MKTILIGLLALGSLSAFASTQEQSFSYPEIDGSYIRANSDMEKVCQLLTKDENSTLKGYSVYRVDYKYYHSVVRVKRSSNKLDPKVYHGSNSPTNTTPFKFRPKIITDITCE
jgi:hypothetical protein